jgi:hypothetical protein
MLHLLNHLHDIQSIPPHPTSGLVDLLMREPLARLQVLLLERRIQHAQPPYLARARRVVALDVGFGFAVCGLEGEGACGLDSQTLAHVGCGEGMVGSIMGGGGRNERGCRCVGDGKGIDVPLSCGASTHSSPRGRAGILLCRCRLRRLCL